MKMEEEVIVAVIPVQQTDQIAQITLLVRLQLYAASQDNAHRNHLCLVPLGRIVLDLSLFNSDDVDLPDI